MSPLSWAPQHRLQPAGAVALERLNIAYRNRFGHDIAITDSYRSYDEQVALKRKKPALAAQPGCSNHGWGRALDLGDGVQNFGSPQYTWMLANAASYGWVAPTWARQGGSLPEPWHWEYRAGDGAGSEAPEPEQAPPAFNGTFLLNNQADGAADIRVNFGNPEDVPVAADWNGDGYDTVGVFRNGAWYRTNQNDLVPVDAVTFNFGVPGDVPVPGDWNNDDIDTNGVFRNGVWYISNDNGGLAHAFTFGQPGDIPVVGDWNNDGTDTPGVFRPATGEWILSDSHDGAESRRFVFGQQGDRPVVGDWDGDGDDTIGIVRASTWHLSNALTGSQQASAEGALLAPFAYGMPGNPALAGDWDGSGAGSPGVGQ